MSLRSAHVVGAVVLWLDAAVAFVAGVLDPPVSVIVLWPIAGVIAAAGIDVWRERR